MRTGILTGLIAGIAAFILAVPGALSNADFAYMCAGGSLLDQGILPVTPYFPPGYPLILWALVKLGLSALTAGILLSAAGIALCAGAVACMARLHDVPPAVAFALGLLGATLPDVFEIGFNPHLDALFTGVAVAFIALAFRLMARDSSAWFSAGAGVLAALLLLLRYHAVFIVLPVTLVLLFNRLPSCRRAAATVFILGGLAAGWSFWSLNVTTGSFETAALKQVTTGAAYRTHGAGYADEIFDDYPHWLANAPAATSADVMEGVRTNWPQFLKRKAVILGILCWLAVLIAFARLPAGSPLMLLFIFGYTLVLSPTYFTPRASALPELVAILLIAASLGVLFASQTGEQKTERDLPNPLILAPVLFLLLLCGIGYNCWREAKVIQSWRSDHARITAMSAEVRELAGGDRLQVLGAIDATWTDDGEWCLPGAVYSRLWLDDPQVAPLVKQLVPRYGDDEIVRGEAPVAAILLWEEHHGRPGRRHELELIERLESSWAWDERIAGESGARVFVRKGHGY